MHFPTLALALLTALNLTLTLSSPLPSSPGAKRGDPDLLPRVQGNSGPPRPPTPMSRGLNVLEARVVGDENTGGGRRGSTAGGARQD